MHLLLLQRIVAKPLIVWLSALLIGLGTGASFYSSPIWAQSFSPEQVKREYHIRPGSLGTVLSRFALAAGITLSFDASLTMGKSSKGIVGVFTAPEGLAHLLAEQNLEAFYTNEGIYLLRVPGDGMSLHVMPTLKVTAFSEGEHFAGYVAQRSVSATKTETLIREIPQSITVLNAARIDEIGEVNLKDVLAYTPGVGAAPYGADSRFDWISIRGFDAYMPGFYLDGLPMRNIGNFALWRTENYGAERVEILRGPSSVLYGQGSPGGVVNIVSKLPTAERIRELKFQGGSHNRKSISGDFAGALDEDESLLYRITFLVRDSELPAGHMQDDRYFVAPSLTWKISPQTKLTVMAQLAETRAGVYANAAPAYGSLLPTPAGTWIDSDKFLGDPNYNRFHQNQGLLGYQLEHRLDDVWTLRQKARISKVKLDSQRLFTNGYVSQNGNPNDPNNYRYLAFTPYARTEAVSSFVIDTQAQADFSLWNWTHILLMGTDYQRTDLDQLVRYGGSAAVMDTWASRYDSAAVTSTTPSLWNKVALTQTGVYVQDQIKRDRWSFTVGGRFDETSKKSIDHLDSNALTSFTDRKFTGRGGFAYLMPNGWAPYASYSKSFAPTDAPNPSTNSGFKSETARQYEIGLRYQPPDGKTLYSAAIFDLRRQNFLTYDSMGAPHQTGDYSIIGLELEAMTSFLRRANFIASYSYTAQAKVTATSDPSLIDTQPMAIPRSRASTWLDYRFSNGLKIGAGLRYEGSTRGTDSAAPKKISSYTLMDVMTGFNLGHWSIALQILNLANKNYIANCTLSACYFGSPRLALLTATYRW